jgi:hypothetical protein
VKIKIAKTLLSSCGANVQLANIRFAKKQKQFALNLNCFYGSSKQKDY